MQTIKNPIRFGRFVGKGVLFGALALTVTGCVAEPYPDYYRSYPNDYSYYHYSEPSRTVIIETDGDGHRGPYYHEDHYYRDPNDHDDPRFNGRRGNGNYHGGNDGAPHDD